MKYYPAFLRLEGRRCVVVGGGDVAERKVFALLEAGALVTVISPVLTERLSGLKEEGRIEHIGRSYEEGDLEGAAVIIAATGDMGVNRKVSRDAGSTPVNVVDVPELCTFIVPSVVRRGALTVAVSTSGVSPALARSIREELEGLFPDATGPFLDHLRAVRKEVLESDLPPPRRSDLLKRIGGREVLRILRTEGLEAAVRHVRDLLAQSG